jgi:hypothetical protein
LLDFTQPFHWNKIPVILTPKRKIGIMKQAIKKTDSFKASTTQHHPESTSVKSNKTEEARLLDLNKTNLFHRYLESSCDCV